MDELNFIVQVSSNTPHCTVTVRRDETDNVTAQCSCENGGSETVCRHRLSILSGQTKWVISDNLLAVKRVLSWVASTDIGHAIINQVHAQQRVQTAKLELEKLTQQLEKAEVELATAQAEAIAAREALVLAINT
ncbi:MAG: hypothetical protein HQL80_13395 [Magnetococcales bacterium]|nr:hypothetical protein [Magnetococcales bacterium]MBF0585209.1 hypothetical protein [Magnetococcales bacterium]